MSGFGSFAKGLKHRANARAGPHPAWGTRAAGGPLARSTAHLITLWSASADDRL